jgi:hypothetical protein
MVLREEIDRRLHCLQIDHNADSFTKSDLNRILKDGPLRMPSGVPIKRVVLLRTMKDPVIVTRKRFDNNSNRMVPDPSPTAARAYLGGNNHHIEIREDDAGTWTGNIVTSYEAARRIRIERLNPIDQSDDSKKGGRFLMSLSEGETVYMRHKDSEDCDYFVVFKLVKPYTILFKRHWDARRAKGEKDADGNIVRGSQREEKAVSARQLKTLAPAGQATPLKVRVDVLGGVRTVEPAHRPADDASIIDARVMTIAREAFAARRDEMAVARSTTGSWSYMRRRLDREGLSHLAPQLSSAIRLLKRASAE